MSNLQNAVDFMTMARADWEAGMCSSSPYSICFHAQQAAEKYLKGFLAFHSQAIPKSHDIRDLINRCASIDTEFQTLLSCADALKPFGVEIRYQSSKEEAETNCHIAWSAMSSIFNIVKQKLPDSVVSVR
jgi:HEPN domain-containing protein